jgi:hypothetical protein
LSFETAHRRVDDREACLAVLPRLQLGAVVVRHPLDGTVVLEVERFGHADARPSSEDLAAVAIGARRQITQSAVIR